MINKNLEKEFEEIEIDKLVSKIEDVNDLAYKKKLIADLN
jgi:hypothetical protein